MPPFPETDDYLTPLERSNLRIVFSRGMLNLLSHAIETRLAHYQATSRLGTQIEWRFVSDDWHDGVYSSQYQLLVKKEPALESLSGATFTVQLVVSDNQRDEELCSEKSLARLDQLLAQS